MNNTSLSLQEIMLVLHKQHQVMLSLMDWCLGTWGIGWRKQEGKWWEGAEPILKKESLEELLCTEMWEGLCRVRMYTGEKSKRTWQKKYVRRVLVASTILCNDYILCVTIYTIYTCDYIHICSLYSKSNGHPHTHTEEGNTEEAKVNFLSSLFEYTNFFKASHLFLFSCFRKKRKQGCQWSVLGTPPNKLLPVQTWAPQSEYKWLLLKPPSKEAPQEPCNKTSEWSLSHHS